MLSDEPAAPLVQVNNLSDLHWPREADMIHWCQSLGPGMAALLLGSGIVYLLWGYPVFRFLMMLNFGVIGAILGSGFGRRADTVLAGAVIGGVLAAAIAWPMMKWAVAITGAALGAVLGAAMWRASGQDIHYDWAGGLTGMVALGMLSFIIFRGGIILFTSLQGAGFLASGFLALAFKYQSMGPRVSNTLLQRPFLLPFAIIIPAVIGLIYQHAQPTIPVGGGPAPAMKKPPGVK